MDLVQAVILGLVQGLTEFIPISSSGHLVLVPWYMNWPKPGLVFDTTLHLGTVVALVVYFWRDLWEIAGAWLFGWTRLRWQTHAGRLGWLIVLGTVPAVVIGLAFEARFEELFAHPGFVGGALIATAAILAFSEWFNTKIIGRDKPGWATALFIGFAQALAITPGISRSGSTIAAGLLSGLNRAAAARFSFLLGIPIIAGAGASQLKDLVEGTEASPGLLALVLGFLTAAVSGYLCIRFLLSYLQRGTLYVFSIYCLIVGLVTVVLWNATGGQGLG